MLADSNALHPGLVSGVVRRMVDGVVGLFHACTLPKLASLSSVRFALKSQVPLFHGDKSKTPSQALPAQHTAVAWDQWRAIPAPKLLASRYKSRLEEIRLFTAAPAQPCGVRPESLHGADLLGDAVQFATA